VNIDPTTLKFEMDIPEARLPSSADPILSERHADSCLIFLRVKEFVNSVIYRKCLLVSMIRIKGNGSILRFSLRLFLSFLSDSWFSGMSGKALNVLLRGYKSVIRLTLIFYFTLVVSMAS